MLSEETPGGYEAAPTVRYDQRWDPRFVNVLRSLQYENDLKEGETAELLHQWADPPLTEMDSITERVNGLWRTTLTLARRSGRRGALVMRADDFKRIEVTMKSWLLASEAVQTWRNDPLTFVQASMINSANGDHRA